MNPRAWIGFGWLLILVAAVCGLLAYARVSVVAGVPDYVSGQRWVALGGVAFAAAFACFFRCAYLRLQHAIRAAADDLGIDLDAPRHW